MEIGYVNDKLVDSGTKLAEAISQAVIGEISKQKISKDDIAGIIGKSVSFVYKVSQKKLSFDFDDLAQIGAKTNIPILKIITDIYSRIPDLEKEEKTANDEMIEFDRKITENMSEIDSLEFEVVEDNDKNVVDWDFIINDKNASDDSVNAGIATLMNDLLNSPNQEKIKFIRGIQKSKGLSIYLRKNKVKAARRVKTQSRRSSDNAIPKQAL